jgi:hypothetical protein
MAGHAEFHAAGVRHGTIQCRKSHATNEENEKTNTHSFF